MDLVGEILIGSRTIAVVGLSPDPARGSHRVARYLKAVGEKITQALRMAEGWGWSNVLKPVQRIETALGCNPQANFSAKA